MSHDPNSTAAFLQIGYRPDSGLLIGRWLCSITDEQLRQGYGSMRRAAQEEQCRHWLVDARRRTDRRLNGPEWVVTHFLPEVQREIGNTLRVAFLLLPNHLREIEEDASLSENKPSPNASFQYARFIDEGPANDWLDQHRRGGG